MKVSNEKKDPSNILDLQKRIDELENQLSEKDLQLKESKDTAAHKRIEEELKRASAAFNSIFEGPENIIAFSLDRNYHYIFFNQAHSQTMKNIWGAEIEIGKNMLDYISFPEDRDKAKNNFDRALSGENLIELEDYGEETLSRRYWENIYNPIQSGNEIIGLTVFCIDITERHKSEESLKENEEKFRAVTESAIDAIVTIDSHGIISFFNHSLLELFGYSASELSDKPVSILIPQKYKNSFLKGMNLLESGEMRRTGKTSLAIGLKKDGTEFPCEVSLSTWKSGQNTYFTAIIRDLTEREKAEDAIIRAKEEWENTFDAVPDLIAIIDTNFRIVRVNKALANRLGVSTEEAVGLICYNVIHGLNTPASFCPLGKLLEDGQEHTAEVHEDRIGGDFIVSVSPLHDSNGELLGSVHVARDITDRKKAEEALRESLASKSKILNALRESEEKYRTIFENVQDVFFQTDISGKIIEISPSVEKYFGISPDRLIGNHVDILYSNPQDREKLLNVLKVKNEVTDYEITLKDNKNQLIYISANIHLIFDEKHDPIGIEGALRDITERKKAEKHINNLKDELSRIFHATGNGMLVINNDYEILRVNKAFLNILDAKEKDILGKKCFNVIPEKNCHTAHCPLDIIHSGRELVNYDDEKEINGKLFNFSINATPFKNDEGQVIGTIISFNDITKRKKAENAVKSQYSFLEHLINTIPYPLFYKDINFAYMGCNKSFEEFIGLPKDEIIGKTVYEISPKDLADKYHAMDKELIENRRLQVYEAPVRYADGSRHEVIFNKSTFTDLEGKIAGLIGIMVDITERKKAERKLKLSEINLANAMDLSHVVNWKLIYPNMIFTFNDRFYSMYGTTASQESGYQMSAEDYVKTFIHPEDAPPIEEGFKQMLETGKPSFPAEVEHRIVRRDGEIRHIIVRIHNIWDDDGKFIGAYGANQDITERKKVEEALRLSQIRLANAMDLAHLANWELDPLTNKFILNDRFYSMLGTTADKEGGYHMSIETYITKYVHPEDAPIIFEGVQSAISAGKKYFKNEFEHRIIRTDGEIRHMAIHVRVISPDEDENPYIHGTIQDITDRGNSIDKEMDTYVYGAIQDVTDRKTIEEKLKQSLDEKDMLIKEIHHRVKNNLMVISSLLNLQSQYIKDKEALDIFKESQNRANSMAMIHERLYRSDNLKKIDFGEYIHTLATDLFRTYVSDPDRIKLNINAENLMVDINTTVPLGLIVNELITNSMKHAFPKKMSGKIDINFKKIDENFLLDVKDNGIGFPEDLDYENTDSLGLQLVTMLVGQIDGEIELISENGTEFKITFKEMYEQ